MKNIKILKWKKGRRGNRCSVNNPDGGKIYSVEFIKHLTDSIPDLESTLFRFGVGKGGERRRSYLIFIARDRTHLGPPSLDIRDGKRWQTVLDIQPGTVNAGYM